MKIYYESDTLQGFAENLHELKDIALHQIAPNGNRDIRNLDDFLNKSKQSTHEDIGFGTLRQHRRMSLMEHLEESGTLSTFLSLF